jgi:uncharacterized protein
MRQFLCIARASVALLLLEAATLVHAEEMPTIMVNQHSDSDTFWRAAQAEEGYQKGHDALAAQRPDIAIRQFEYSCEKGNAKSCFNVGLLTEDQARATLKGAAPGPAMVATIVEAFAAACDNGFQRGCAMLVQYYRLADYGMQDLPKALRLARTACVTAEIGACDDLAEMHYRGEGVAVDLTGAAQLFKSSCDAGGRALSCFNYGLMNEKGQGIATNEALAHDYYRIGCRRGSDMACINLAVDYSRRANIADDLATGMGLFAKSCERGAVVACNNLAALTLDYDKSQSAKGKAATLYRKACDAGDGDACRGLGNLAQDGVREAGTPREAIRHFIRGCELGSGISCYNAGFLYFIGYKTPKRPLTALYWFAQGCELRSASSCAGASLASYTKKPAHPNLGEEAARRWLNYARYLDPGNGLVKSLEGWLDAGAEQARIPNLAIPTTTKP